jgi:putative DNA primase/helicase
MLQADARRSYTQSGTPKEWQDNLACLCVDNTRLMLAVCVAFAGPLLYFAGQESGGINLIGASSIGKTTNLVAASSVFGGPGYIQTWRATSNGLRDCARCIPTRCWYWTKWARSTRAKQGRFPT